MGGFYIVEVSVSVYKKGLWEEAILAFHGELAGCDLLTPVQLQSPVARYL